MAKTSLQLVATIALVPLLSLVPECGAGAFPCNIFSCGYCPSTRLQLECPQLCEVVCQRQPTDGKHLQARVGGRRPNATSAPVYERTRPAWLVRQILRPVTRAPPPPPPAEKKADSFETFAREVRRRRPHSVLETRPRRPTQSVDQLLASREQRLHRLFYNGALDRLVKDAKKPHKEHQGGRAAPKRLLVPKTDSAADLYPDDLFDYYYHQAESQNTDSGSSEDSSAEERSDHSAEAQLSAEGALGARAIGNFNGRGKGSERSKSVEETTRQSTATTTEKEASIEVGYDSEAEESRELGKDESYEQCCAQNANMDATCRKYCAFDQFNRQTLTRMYVRKECSDTSIGHIMVCISNRKDHRACCSSAGVPDVCAHFCHPTNNLSKPTAKDLICLAYVDTMRQCFEANYFA